MVVDGVFDVLGVIVPLGWWRVVLLFNRVLKSSWLLLVWIGFVVVMELVAVAPIYFDDAVTATYLLVVCYSNKNNTTNHMLVVRGILSPNL